MVQEQSGTAPVVQDQPERHLWYMQEQPGTTSVVQDQENIKDQILPEIKIFFYFMKRITYFFEKNVSIYH